MGLRHSLILFYQNNQFLRNHGTLKITLLQCYEVLWIHNIDAICTTKIKTPNYFIKCRNFWRPGAHFKNKNLLKDTFTSWWGLNLERTHYRNESKRPAISEPKQILNVTSRLLSGILCKQYTYLFKKKINENKVMSGLTQYSKYKIFDLVPKKLVSWNHSYNKYALIEKKSFFDT